MPSQDPISQKQINFINVLLDEREVEGRETLRGVVPTMRMGTASELITHLKSLPKKTAAAAGTRSAVKEEWAAIPNGRYALEDPEDTLNPVKFYRVKHGGKTRTGKDWTGRIFLDRYASDETYPVRGATFAQVLDAIAVNPLEAAQRYGHEHNSCGICGRGLTRALSRELGIGPVCGARCGITDDMISMAKDALIARGIDPDADYEADEAHDDHYWDAQMQQRERAEAEAVARFKMERDAHLIDIQFNA